MAMSRSSSDFGAERARMVAEQLKARGIHDRAVLAGMRMLPRHLFVDPTLAERAYDDTPLPIGEHQTISQPYMVALMTQVLAPQPGERVLEIGTGSGYQTAILASLGAQVLSLERIPELASRARARLESFGFGERVVVKVADGTLGWPDEAPYDGIIVTAGAPVIPRPLVEQLGPSGRLVLPMGEEELQSLVRIRRAAGGLFEEYFGECRFVKLLGSHGWEES
jgi:protein-L-isoaspartate(D-aspartate) O-methyltransferase